MPDRRIPAAESPAPAYPDAEQYASRRSACLRALGWGLAGAAALGLSGCGQVTDFTSRHFNIPARPSVPLAGSVPVPAPSPAPALPKPVSPVQGNGPLPSAQSGQEKPNGTETPAR